MKKILALMAIILLVSAPVLAQEIDYCEGNFDYDQDVDGADASVFKSDFGRSTFKNPCPPPNPAPSLIPKTGQTISYYPGDDGDLEKGVIWPNPRFTDNLDGTVTDNQTGLMWLKDANCIATNYPGFDNDDIAGDGRVTWQHALDFVAGINDNTFPDCGAGLTEWRLPNKNELASLIHSAYYDRSMPNTAGNGQWSEGDPFSNVQDNFYWSSTTWAGTSLSAWCVYFLSGTTEQGYGKGNDYSTWPVRGGQ